MKTIAITIEETMLDRVDELAEKEGLNRSEFVREAVQDYVSRKDAEVEEEREREIFRKHKKKLKRQTSALVREQAKI
jgi:metal-responsive CopG/Arc/MetJ family transcriptional regulator